MVIVIVIIIIRTTIIILPDVLVIVLFPHFAFHLMTLASPKACVVDLTRECGFDCSSRKATDNCRGLGVLSKRQVVSSYVMVSENPGPVWKSFKQGL